VAQQGAAPAQQPINFSPSGLVNPFNPNPGMIAEAGARGIGAERFSGAAGPISRSGTGYSFMTGRGSKVDVAGTPSAPRPQQQLPQQPIQQVTGYQGEDYF
jgi:hypothetical protein